MFFQYYSVLVLVCLCVFCNSLEKKEIYNYIEVCEHDSPTINGCIRRSIELLKPLLRTGISELGVPSIDPFFIRDEFSIEVQPAGSPNPIQVTLRNLTVSGAGDFKIKRLSADMKKNLKMKGRVRFPKLRMEGDYTMSSMLLFFSVTSEGKFHAVAEKCDAALVIYPEVVQRNGTDYINFTGIDTNINIRDYNVQLDGYTDSDRPLSEMGNNVINANRGEFLKAIKPRMEEAVSMMLLNIANNLVREYRLDQLLLIPSRFI